MFALKSIVCLLVLAISTSLVEGYSSGAPAGACTSITPGHGGSSQTIPGGFFIYSNLIDCGGTYTANTAYTIRLEGSQQFRGFLIQARQSGTSTPIGSFSSLPSGTETLSCSGAATASVTHSNSVLKTSVEFTWTSPSTSGTVEFRYAVVIQNSGGVNTYYANINAADHRPSGAVCSSSSASPSSTTTSPSPTSSSASPSSTSTTTSPSPTSSSALPSSTSTTTSPSPTSSSALPPSTSQPSPSTSSSMVQPTNTPSVCPSTDKTSSSSFPLIFKSPSDCDRQDCSYYWAMGNNTANPQYLDIYMEGNVDGWIGVGFSQDMLMGNTDVLSCYISNGMVSVMDGWNPSGSRSNEKDDNQDGICIHETSSNSGRISCLFSRLAGVSNPGQDIDLNNPLHIIRGYRTGAQSDFDNLRYHSDTPAASTTQYNPLRDTNDVVTTPPTIICPSGPSLNATYTANVSFPNNNGYFFGVRVNPDSNNFIDIVLEADVTGWVGVGFSQSSSMFDADVLACKRDSSTGMVYAIDTWNPSSPARTNNIDDNQNGMCQHNAVYTNGRIRCSFSRFTGVINTDQDLDLNQELYQLYAMSDNGGSRDTSLRIHSYVPSVSSARTNPLTSNATGTGGIFPKLQLIKTHGILMICTWLLLVSSAMFFAAWMKPLLPNGEWFKVHYILMSISLFIGVIGVIFAFVANARSPNPGFIGTFNASNIIHFVFGVIITLFHISNPIIAIFRCKPNGKWRWIFNMIHAHSVGYGALLLALINIGIGIGLVESAASGSLRILWFYIAFVILMISYFIVLFIIYTINAFRAPESDRPALVHSIIKYKYLFASMKASSSNDYKEEMKDMKNESDSNEKSEDVKKEKKKPLKSAPVIIGWISVAIYLAAVIIVFFILLILIALLGIIRL